jgi:predicted transcriptional regulator
MIRKSTPKPTPAELEVLRILWESGPLTVRQVHRQFIADRPMGYTGVLKLLQNLFEKGLVGRDENEHAHIYEAKNPYGMKRKLLSEVVRMIFAGSASQLVLHLLADKSATPDEIREIERLLAAHRGKQK